MAPLKKVDLVDAFSAASISLKVLAGKVEVDVVNFMTLALGDVVAFPASVDMPLDGSGLGRSPLFGGHLGTLDKSMAIEACITRITINNMWSKL